MKLIYFSSYLTENFLEIILGSEIYSKAHFLPELQRIKEKTQGLLAPPVCNEKFQLRSEEFQLCNEKFWLRSEEIQLCNEKFWLYSEDFQLCNE